MDLWTSIYKLSCKNSHAYEQSTSFISIKMSDLSTFVPSGKDLMGMGYERRLKLLFLSYWTNNASLHSWHWGTLMDYTILLWTLRLYGRQTYKCETTGLIWSNLGHFFEICALIALPYAKAYFNIACSTLCLIMLKLVKLPLGGDGIFSIDRNNCQ